MQARLLVPAPEPGLVQYLFLSRVGLARLALGLGLGLGLARLTLGLGLGLGLARLTLGLGLGLGLARLTVWLTSTRLPPAVARVEAGARALSCACEWHVVARREAHAVGLAVGETLALAEAAPAGVNVRVTTALV